MEEFNNGYLDSENKITVQETLTDSIRTSEKLEAIPNLEREYREKIAPEVQKRNENVEE